MGNERFQCLFSRYPHFAGKSQLVKIPICTGIALFYLNRLENVKPEGYFLK